MTEISNGINKPMLSIVINTYNRKNYLFALIESILKTDIHTTEHEIIVVDDKSDEDYTLQIKQQFPNVKFIRNNFRSFLVKSRNLGWKEAVGNLVFFIDDDNEIFDQNFFSKAQETLKNNKNIGILGCRTYYFDKPNILLVGQNKFNKYTGKTTFIGVNEVDSKLNEDILDTHDNPNAFFVKKSTLLKVDGFTEQIIQTFSEADFAEKIRKEGFRVVQYTGLKCYHKSKPTQLTASKLTPRNLGGSPERFYYLMRNRFFFISKHGTALQSIIFCLIFSHIYTLFYSWILIRNKSYSMLFSGLKGVLHGFIYCVSGILLNAYQK